MNNVYIGEVRTFDHVEPNKEQALKALEESAEVFAAWQLLNEAMELNEIRGDSLSNNALRDNILSECADVIQAVCNLVASLGVYDMKTCMELCYQRNRERGRITD